MIDIFPDEFWGEFLKFGNQFGICQFFFADGNAYAVYGFAIFDMQRKWCSR
jgi:hypothetical protein